jgi:hypothetical protein
MVLRTGDRTLQQRVVRCDHAASQPGQQIVAQLSPGRFAGKVAAFCRVGAQVTQLDVGGVHLGWILLTGDVGPQLPALRRILNSKSGAEIEGHAQKAYASNARKRSIA